MEEGGKREEQRVERGGKRKNKEEIRTKRNDETEKARGGIGN